MNRRDFQTGLILSGLSAAGPAHAFNEKDENSRSDRVADRARVKLQHLMATVTLTWFIVYARSGLLGLDLRQPSRRFDENVADTSRIPLLGQLTRQTLAQRFAASIVVGQLVLLNTMLVLLPGTNRRLAGKSVAIANRDQSWEPSGRLQPVQLSRFPTIGDLMAREKVGTAYLKGDELLVIVNPSIVRPDER